MNQKRVIFRPKITRFCIGFIFNLSIPFDVRKDDGSVIVKQK
ncbi:hypothetical protein RG47T_0013 [Mucilaginibacter polytrichastri]|uniref:Uncharacterized protein n=1 Tax=Mucilaginibacter polytrichastri TaxID=1302689 RepID=A0A1Q5ZS32_9SPHI|nr:hypothetical protein RG47T_0013 [Mucilaginibacter polytrichastri]